MSVPVDPLEEIRADGLEVLFLYSSGHVFVLHETFDVQRKFALIFKEEQDFEFQVRSANHQSSCLFQLFPVISD